MKCPVGTAVNLKMSDRQGVEIDYCPQCRGVWLDRGELDKLIERAQAMTPQAASPAKPPASQYAPLRGHEERFGRGNEYRDHHPDYRSRKKRSFLGEIFDFD